MPAAAVTLSRADAGTFLRYEHGGEQVIGVMAKDSTNNYYCIEADERVEYQLGESVKLRDDDTARRLGWLMDHYRDGTAAEHAAIAVLAHDLLDLKPDTWKARRVSAMRDNPTLRRKVEQMWEEAGSNAPANATVTRTYAEGHADRARHGVGDQCAGEDDRRDQIRRDAERSGGVRERERDGDRDIRGGAGRVLVEGDRRG